MGIVGGGVATCSACSVGSGCSGEGIIFRAALSRGLVAGEVASVRLLKWSSVERDAHQASASMLKQAFAEAKLPVMPSSTHIVPLLVGDPVKTKDRKSTRLNSSHSCASRMPSSA